jgi:acyl dehydratase
MDDTVSLSMEVTEARELSSRDDAGLVVLDSTLTNQDDEVVFEGDMKFLIEMRE